jgi:hypothetical protein
MCRSPENASTRAKPSSTWKTSHGERSVDTWRWNHIRRFLWQPGAFFSGGRRLILTSMEKGDWAGRSIAVLM